MLRTRRARAAGGLGSLRVRAGRTPIAAATLMILGLAAPSGAEKATLVFSAPVDTLHYTLEMGREANLGGITVSTMEKGKVHITPLEKGDDKTRVAIHFADFEASMKRGEELVEQKSQLNGVTVEAQVSRRGEVLAVTPRGAAPPGGIEQIQTLADHFFPYFPDTPVESGATWVRKRLVPNTADPTAKPRLDGSTEFTLDELKKKEGVQVASILAKSTAKANLPMPQGDFEGKVTGEAKLLVAVQGGHLLESKSSAEFVGTTAGNDLSWVQTTRMKRVK